MEHRGKDNSKAFRPRSSSCKGRMEPTSSNCSLQRLLHTTQGKMVLERTSSGLPNSSWEQGVNHQQCLEVACPHSLTATKMIHCHHFSGKSHLYVPLKSKPDTLKITQAWSYFSSWPSPHTWPGNNFKLETKLHSSSHSSSHQLSNTKTGCRMKFIVTAAYPSQ